jgi:DNA-binding NarL/FixJ family response regulator
MIRVVLADAHPIVRQGLRTLLEGGTAATSWGKPPTA